MHDQIRDRLALPFADGGEQSVRNIARPVSVYTLPAEAVAGLPKPEEVQSAFPATRPSYVRRYVAAIALAGLLIIAGGLWLLWSSQSMRLANITAPAASTAALPTQRLSIVVLPFANLSDEREQQHFADGITEDLTTDLSLISGLLVISRNTAYTYKGKTVDAKQIGRELGVHYVLEGSVRQAGSQVRINVQLIDAENNAHVWAERFDRDTGDLFALQNEITGRLANSLGLTLYCNEANRPTANPDVLDYRYRARAAAAKLYSREKYAEAIGLYERALEIDPKLDWALAGLVTQLTGRVLDQMTDTATADMARAEELIKQALAAAPGSPSVHFTNGQVLRAQRRCAEAVSEYETALAYNRNYVYAFFALGQCKLHTGSIEETIPFLPRK